MNILRRWLGATKEAEQTAAAQPAVNQRIQVTVERETITMLVRGQIVENQIVPVTQDVPVREIDGLDAGHLLALPLGTTEKGEKQ
jgi:hypothetical protein